MAEKTDSPKKKRAGRSPSFPCIDIQMALKRAQELYVNAQQYSSPIEIVAKHWGYKSRTSLTDIIVAALIRYGFLVSEGTAKDRTVRLTELALDIIKDKRDDSTARNQKIIQAALNPQIHQELFKKYELKPVSDADLLWELEKSMGFTPNGAKDFLSQYKRTLRFISSIKSDIISPGNSDKGRQGEEIKPPIVNPSAGGMVTPPPPPKGGNVQTIQIPMLDGVWPALTAQFPMTEDDWTYMIGVLETMKPRLVKSTPPPGIENVEIEYDEK